jgi:hypothetical protein
MSKYDFWDKWKNKSDIEIRAIDSVIEARDLVINSVSTDALIAIYIKGKKILGKICFHKETLRSKKIFLFIPVRRFFRKKKHERSKKRSRE